MKEELRNRINELDEQLVSIFAQRMKIAGEIAEYKKENNLPVFDLKREKEIMENIRAISPEDSVEYTELLYPVIFELSRSYQNKLIGKTTGLMQTINSAIENTEKVFPERTVVACQGTDGAFSQMAADKLFKHENVMFFSSFDAVFTAIEKGLCRYGVIPLENSTAGSVNSVYDLMMEHNFYIVRSIRVKIDHNLLAKPNTKLSEIKEIYSHEQAIGQCSKFLSGLSDVKIIPCENTAVAAKMISESERTDVAAIASRASAKYYGLECVNESIQDQDNNYTRFICISKDLEIYPGADRTSLMAVLPHEAGSLCRLLSRLYALNINLIKLESRPLPDRDFEFMFYLDLDTSVYSEQFARLMDELSDVCESFYYLGSYSEMV